MNISLGTLKASEPALRKLLNSDLPISTAFVLSKLIKSIETELTTYEEQRQSLVKKHGVADAEGNVQVQESAFAGFFTDLTELHNVNVEIAFTPLSVSKLDGVKLTAVDLVSLDGFVTE